MKTTAIDNENKHQKFSILGTFLWMFLLSVGIQAGVGIILGIAFNVSETETKDIEFAFLRPDIMLTMVIMTAIISIPLIKKAAHSTEKIFPFVFLALKPIQQTTLIKILVLGTLYYCFMSMFMLLLGIDMPQYMLDAKSQVNSTLDLVLQITAICIIGPIFEEVVFRGLAFSRFQYSKLGQNGSVLITSIIFTLIHFQYEPIIMTFVFATALVLGFVRYKTDNLTYCIALHILFNSLSTFELFILT